MHRSLKSLFVFGFAAIAASNLSTPCSHGSGPPRSARAVSPRLATQGERIYFGDVFPLETAASKPTFVYERRVASQGNALVSTHVTRTRTGQVALAEEATHTKDYALSRYELHTNQAGQRGSIRVDRGDVYFQLVDGAHEETAVERHQASPVVVGPTLVGYIVRHLPDLRAGKHLGLRMAILDRLETIGFDLESVPGHGGETRVRMTPSSFIVGLVVEPVLFTFESSTSKLVRLEGRVPTKLPTTAGLEDFDARVEYRFVASRYL